MSDAERLALRIDRVGPAMTEPGLTLLLLPAAATRADDFVQQGFYDDLADFGVAAMVARSEVPVDMYAADRVVTLLRQEWLQPQGAGTAGPLWVVGISLGAMTALACAEAHRDLIDGVLAIAPWPGLRPTWSDVPEAGGIAAWAARHAGAHFDDERRVWRWLGSLAHSKPEIFIGYGTQDRFVEGQRLLSAALPPAQRLLVEGTHDWPTWRALWRRFLEQHAHRWARAPARSSARPG